MQYHIKQLSIAGFSTSIIMMMTFFMLIGLVWMLSAPSFSMADQCPIGIKMFSTVYPDVMC